MKKIDQAVPQEQLVVETFDRMAPTYAAGYQGHSGTAHSFSVRRHRIYELVGDRQVGTMLDVGCGPGVTTEYFAERGFEFYGVDISTEMIHECTAKFAHLRAAHFSAGVIERLDFADAFFDVVTCMGVVEYVDEDSLAVKEMARVTKPGGIVIVTLPNKWSPYRLWQRLVYRGVRALARTLTGRGSAPAEIAHREYRESAYCRLLASHGLGVVDVVYYNFRLLPFPLDRLLPGLTVALSRKLEWLGRGPLRWLGTGLVVKAQRS